MELIRPRCFFWNCYLLRCAILFRHIIISYIFWHNFTKVGYTIYKMYLLRQKEGLLPSPKSMLTFNWTCSQCYKYCLDMLFFSFFSHELTCLLNSSTDFLKHVAFLKPSFIHNYLMLASGDVNFFDVSLCLSKQIYHTFLCLKRFLYALHYVGTFEKPF